MSQHQNESIPSQSASLFLAISAAIAATAAVATFLSVSSGLPLWAMFIGWVAFFTRPATVREILRSFSCIALGLLLGGVAAMALGRLGPVLGHASIVVVVFLVALIVVSLRSVPFVNNVLCYFIGLTAFFAAHSASEAPSIEKLAGASALGLLAGWGAHTLQHLLGSSQRQHV